MRQTVTHAAGDRQGPKGAAGTQPPAGGALLSDQRVEEGLAGVQRAVATSQFYPANHPLATDAVRDGFRAWQGLEEDHRLQESGLRLRGGTLWLADARIGAENPAVLNLARTFSAHEIVGLRATTPLSLEAFSQFVQFLAKAPETLLAQGGLTAAWRRSPHAPSLQLQQLAVAAAGQQDADRPSPAGSTGDQWGQGLSQGADLPALADPLLLARLKLFQRGPRERRVLDLLLRLGRTEDITHFLSLLKEIAQLTQEYLDTERFREGFHVALFLYREAQNMDALGKEGKRDYLLDALRLIVKGPFLQWLITQVKGGRADEETDVGSYLLRALGKGAVVPLINALIAEKDRVGRRRLLDVLVAIGDPVVPFAVKMLEDQRWFVVRNMVTILGGVASADALRALERLAKDADARIRREVVRALGRMAAPGASDVLLTFLADPDPAVRLLTVATAGAHRSSAVLEALVRLYHTTGRSAADWSLREALLQSMGRLGFAEALPVLESVVRKRPFFGRRRWEALQVVAAQALGDLGETVGEPACRLLEELKGHRSLLVQRAAARALASLGGACTEDPPCPPA